MGRRQGESREVKSLKKIQAVLIHFPFGSFNEYFILYWTPLTWIRKNADKNMQIEDPLKEAERIIDARDYSDL